MSKVTKESILKALSTVKDPVSGNNIVAREMVTGLVIREGNIGFAIDIGHADPKDFEATKAEAEKAVRAVNGVLSVTVALTAEKETSSKEKKEPTLETAKPKPPPRMPIPGIKWIIAVASGKGGVGKSTTAVNLALALKEKGLKVGLLDADIYGPSIPKLLSIHEKPSADGKKIQPLEAYGLKVMSMGFMVDEEAPMIWRGPMVAGALQQMLNDVAWGELDVLVVDMPPGTGDAQLTLAQRVPVTGAVIVSTPQDIALIDARKGLRMFERVGIPILGLIENMTTFECPHCGKESHIFGHGGAIEAAKAMKAHVLGGIPLTLALRESSDAGKPIVAEQPESKEAKAFLAIAADIHQQLEKITA